jgi:hypothetical protein
MVNRLSELANFLDQDSLPMWLKEALSAKQPEITAALQNGQEFTLTGPHGEKVTIAPKHATAAA